MVFITRSGSQLMNGASVFRFSGCNAYWLGMLNNPTAYPSLFQIDDGLSTAKEMGATVVRSLSLGESVGNSLSIWPSLNTTNLMAFNAIDYAIYKARVLGLRLIIPLVDNWHFSSTGGKHTFTDWEGLTDETLFYTNTQVIADFEAYISVILNRVNRYTGVAYKNDPTILAWQLGNELSAPFPPSSWSSAISAYIKSVDANHLVMDGACSSQGMNTASSNLSISTIDIYDDHYYPTLSSTLSSDASAVSAQSKAFVVGEFDWTKNISGTGNGNVALDTTVPPAGGTQSAKVTVIQQASKYFYIQVVQDTLTTTNGHTYALSFWAKTLAPYTMQVTLQSLAGPSFTVYEQVGFNLTTSWQQFTFPNYTQTTTDTNTGVVFNFGNAATTTWIDLVSLTDTASPGTNLLSNPSFENSTILPWRLILKNVPSDDLSVFLSSVEGSTNVSGDLFWSLLPHNAASGFFINPEIYSLYYPGQTTDQQTRAQLLRTHAYKMQGASSAPSAGTVAPPHLNQVTGNTVYWRGAAGAVKYDIERSTTGANGTFSLVGAGITDFQAPWTGSGPYQTGWYRVKAYNNNGVAGPYSNVVQSMPLAAIRRDGTIPTSVTRRDGIRAETWRRG